jgi:pimeloyl-ACP methyl ester carboxylesterase
VLAAGCGGRAYTSTRGARIEHRAGGEIVVVPRRHGSWTLVLLHGRGAGPKQFLMQPLFDELAALGRRAPVVLLLDGGDHSYWHDRADGSWQSMVFGEGIPIGVRAAHAKRIAIGGISMGGYGALLLGARNTYFCAVGAHSPALWEHAADTAPGAFDSATDFARNDLFAERERYGVPVWIDVGSSDPFHDADVAFAHRVHAQLHVWPGGHETSYWRAHLAAYLRFYAQACS